MCEYSAIRIAVYTVWIVLCTDHSYMIRPNVSIYKESVVVSLSRVDGRDVCTGRDGKDALIHTSNSG